MARAQRSGQVATASGRVVGAMLRQGEQFMEVRADWVMTTCTTRTGVS
jgi:hypothetical protein